MTFIIKRIQNEVHSRIDEDLADNKLTEEQAQSAKGGANAALGLLSLELPRPTHYESDCEEEWQIAHWEDNGFDVAILEEDEYNEGELAVRVLDSMHSGSDEQLEKVALTILAAAQLKRLKEAENERAG